MKITHHAGRLSLDRTVQPGGQGILLTNRAGSYAWLNAAGSGMPISKYQGVFFYAKDRRMMKIIESISPLGAGSITKVDNYLTFVERGREHVTERIVMPRHFSALCYQLSKPMKIELCLDMRESYDSRNFGRYYTQYVEKNRLVVEFVKKTDEKEDSEHGREEYRLFLVIAAKTAAKKGALKEALQPAHRWVKHDYSFDRRRGDEASRYVFSLGTIEAEEFVFAFSGNKQHAHREAAYLQKNMKHLFRRPDVHLPKKLSIPDDNVRMAYLNAVHALSSLSAHHHGYFAGLPWFFQYWSRDSLISAKALMLAGRQEEAKRMLMQYAHHIDHEGRLPARIPAAQLHAADSTGWLFVRLEECWKMHHLSRGEKHRFREALHKALLRIQRYQVQEGLVYNNKRETWMDTDESGNGRAGYRIELHALYLAMHRIMYELEPLRGRAQSEKHLKHLVRKNFWDGRLLHDGCNDPTIRPNIFIAAYAYPHLLTQHEWTACFDHALKALRLDWGGLASIDKRDKRFRKSHTGTKNTSYHAGDSWFFINNMAAIVLHRTDRHRYRSAIQSILKSSTSEILWHGMLGCHAEISSAAKMEPLGCQNQLWSNAMYIELVHELFS